MTEPNDPGPDPVEPTSPRRGARPRPRAGTEHRRSVVLASVLSAFMPGLGQIYLGFYQRGFVHVLVFAGTIFLLARGGSDAGNLAPFLGIFLGFFYLYNIVDAGRRATLVNLAIDGYGEDPTVLNFVREQNEGSVTGGLLLAAAGTVLFLHLKFDVSMYWLEEWWPLGLVAFGLYLFWRGRRSSPRADGA